MVVNIAIVLFIVIALVGFFIKDNSYYPLSILGLATCGLLLKNRENGFLLVAVECFFWTLANAYGVPSDGMTFRFFHQSGFLTSWLPFLVSAVVLLLFFIKKKEAAWWKYCKKLSIEDVVVLTLTGVFRLWVVYSDTVTKWGLHLNIRHYIKRLL